LKPETYPKSEELGQCDAILHTVGALLEGGEYKNNVSGNILEQLSNPGQLFRNVATSAAQASSGGNNVPYEESL